MAIHVDINARVISENHCAFLARPGKGCRYLNLFRKMQAIGPDLPFMKLKPGVPIAEHDDLDDMLKRAVAYRRWRPKARREDPPPEELFYYRHERRVHTKSAIQFVKILKGYFEIAKKGDLALVPPSAWKSDALLIEFSTDPHDFIYSRP